jgi:hypothetical protein
MRLIRLIRLAVPFVLLAATTCSGGGGQQSGDFAAERTGSLNQHLAQRVAPDLELIEACGSGTVTDTGQAQLERPPFLQQVTSHGALVVFRAASPAQSLELSTFDGQPVASVVPERDPTVSDGHQWIARLDGLSPATGYCYALPGWTKPAGFHTAPRPDGGSPVRFVAFGDSGYGGGDQRAVLDQVRTVPFDFMIHTGDVAYSDGSAAELDRNFFRVYAPILRSFAVYPTTGNHDYSTDDAAPYLSAFVLPEAGGSERWYSFDWGDAHFVALDTERIGTEQAAWLDADLMTNRLPWVVVYGHRPPYSSGDHGSDQAFQHWFVPVLERYQVPLVLSGHDHDYERSKELNGVTYVVTGGGGRGTREVGTSSFSAFSEAVLHFVYVEIAGSRLVLHAIDATGREFDQLLIERSAG